MFVNPNSNTSQHADFPSPPTGDVFFLGKWKIPLYKGPLLFLHMSIFWTFLMSHRQF
jgi:hypothetical protein